MPGMDGFEMTRRMRQEPALAGTMLVALTGYGQEEDRERIHRVEDSLLGNPERNVNRYNNRRYDP